LPRTDYTTPASERATRLIEEIFALGKIGYVAFESGGHVLMREAQGLTSQTTPESNFYEELLVNPTLVKLARQRAELDCGGLDYVAIGYRNFMQVVMPTRTGHVSIGVSRKTQPGEFAKRVQQVLDRNQEAATTLESGLIKAND
jgi:hypothetical protein